MQSLPFCNQTGDSENQGDSDRFNLQPATNWLLSQLSVVQWRKPASTFSLYSNVSPSCLCFSSIPCSPFLDLSSFLHVLHPLFFFIICHIAASSLLSFLPHLSPSPLLKLISFWSSPLFLTFFDPVCLALLESSSQLLLSQRSLSSLSFRSFNPFFFLYPSCTFPVFPLTLPFTHFMNFSSSFSHFTWNGWKCTYCLLLPFPLFSFLDSSLSSFLSLLSFYSLFHFLHLSGSRSNSLTAPTLYPIYSVTPSNLLALLRHWVCSQERGHDVI